MNSKFFFFVMMLTVVGSVASKAQNAAPDPVNNAVSFNADGINYVPGWFGEAVANEFSGYFKAGEGEGGFTFDGFKSFFSNGNGKIITPVIQLEYTDKTTSICQFYEDDPTGVKAAILCNNSVIRVLTPQYTEMLSPAYSCWGYPLGNVISHSDNGRLYQTQTFMSRCESYQTVIYFLPYPLEYYPSLRDKAELLGPCKGGSLYK